MTFKPGQTVKVRDEVITIIRLYPKGHHKASLNHAYYHVNFTEGDDIWREDILLELVNEYKLITQQ